MTEMRGLSVRQPYAWAIACAGKTVENRSRPTRYRGLLAIHASKTKPSSDDVHNPLILNAIAELGNVIDPAASSMGAIVAVAELYGCHQWPDAGSCNGRGRPPCSPWASPDQWHWKLRKVRPLPEPVPCRGMLGLWRLPDDVEKAVRKQLEATDVQIRS